MKVKAEIMDRAAMDRAIIRISHEIIERNNGANNLILVGIKRRGIPLAHKIAKNIKNAYNVDVPVGYLDITLYRDDLSLKDDVDLPKVNDTKIGQDIQNKKIVLVDDVLYTGRTIRAAIDAIFELGRPSKIEAAILIDRGHRELPIKADYVGKNIPTSSKEIISVMLDEYDKEQKVILLERSV